MPILIILFIGGFLLYAVIPITIDFVNLQYTGKSTLLQIWGHFILSIMYLHDQPVHKVIIEGCTGSRNCCTEFPDVLY